MAKVNNFEKISLTYRTIYSQVGGAFDAIGNVVAIVIVEIECQYHAYSEFVFEIFWLVLELLRISNARKRCKLLVPKVILP